MSMATLFCFSNPTVSHPLAFASLRAPPFPNSPAIRLAVCRRKARGSALAARAGPSTSSIVFAISLPLSLLVVTVFASLRISDKLDQQWLEEMAKNEALMEVDEEDDDERDDEDYDDIDDDINDEKKDDMETYVPQPALPNVRNRPKREV